MAEPTPAHAEWQAVGLAAHREAADRYARKLAAAVPHGPGEPCTCPGCWACAGYVVGCTCDIDWDALAELREEGR